jgi:hypothetical protein
MYKEGPLGRVTAILSPNRIKPLTVTLFPDAVVYAAGPLTRLSSIQR